MIKQRYQLLLVCAVIIIALSIWTANRTMLIMPVKRKRKESRQSVKTGDLLLFSSHFDVIGDMIKMSTGCAFTHVAIAFVDAYGEPFVFEITPFKGCKLTRLSDRLNKPGLICVIRHLTPAIDGAAMETIITPLIGMSYDGAITTGLRAHLSTWGISDIKNDGHALKNKRFCSELVAYVYAQLGVLCFTKTWRKDVTLIMPSDFTHEYQDLPLGPAFSFGPEFHLR
jgi:hypothetical protein